MQMLLSTIYFLSQSFSTNAFTLQQIIRTLCKQNQSFLESSTTLYRDIDVGVNPRSSDLESDETETGYGTQYDDKSKYRFLNSFNMFKGLRLSYSYRVDSDGPLVGNKNLEIFNQY